MTRYSISILLGLVIPYVLLAQDAPVPAQGQSEVKIFSLVSLSAEVAVDTLATLLGKQTGENFTFDAGRNVVIAQATPERLRMIEGLLLKLDSTPVPTSKTMVYRLRHARASTVRNVLKEIYNDSSESARIGIDERTNSLVVNALPETHTQIERLIEQIDPAVDHSQDGSAENAIQLEIYWIAEGDETTDLPIEIRQILKKNGPNSDMGISHPQILARALVATYVDGSLRGGRVSLQHVKSIDGSELNLVATIHSLDERLYKVDLQLTAGAESPTVIQTTVQTVLGHFVFVAATTTRSGSENPSVFVVRLSK